MMASLLWTSAILWGADPYLIGRAISDVTLPVVGVQMLGYVKPDQISEGLRTRQFCRTFVIADAKDTKRVALITADIAFPTHTLKLAVLERLEVKLPGRFDHASLVVTGTHTHGVPGGYHHHLAASPLGGILFGETFDELADGIAESVIAASADLKPGRIYFGQAEVEGANENRSLVAYENNPPEERAKYNAPVDKLMTLLKFVRGKETIGCLNWFAVHPTSMNNHNKLINGDNKGYAAYLLEQERGTRYAGKPEFVAAFAQSNCGDVTPNLNLDLTGPGKTDRESTEIIGRRQADVARKLLESASEEITGPIDLRHAFVDFSNVEVADEFTGAGPQRTSPSAFGYGFAAGSTEDGTGPPLFKEGMLKPNPLVDGVVRAVMPNVVPTEDFKKAQSPKVVLFATGLAKPPMHEQVLPLGLVRLGSIYLAVGSAEYTTMTGRRIRGAVAKEFGVEPRRVVIAGYANDFSGYVTTREEYQVQHYEGGHTLYGPWSEAANRQEFARLARAMKGGTPTTSDVKPVDMRTLNLPSVALGGPDTEPPSGGKFGDVVTDAKESCRPGEVVSVVFWTGSPVDEYKRTDRFMVVERKTEEGWEVAREDFDWETTCHWKQSVPEKTGKETKDLKSQLLSYGPPPYSPKPAPFQVEVTWEPVDATPAGTYRLVHFGKFKAKGKVERFRAESRPFEVTR